MTDRYSFLKNHEEDIRNDLINIVQAESPTLQKELVDITGNLLKEMMLKRLGNDYICTVYPQQEYGDHLLFEKNGTSKPRILFLSHFDTVWQKGELPIRFEDQKMYGPGVFDMKAGLLSSIWAVASLEKTMDALPVSPVFLFTSDEETGSMSSRELIEQVAKTCEAVFVMEPAEAHTNALKTARKGVGIYNIEVEGISAHAGNHHEDGVNAILEIAYLVQQLEELTDYAKGTTVNVGMIHGGTASNVVPEHASIEVDFRVTSLQEADRIMNSIEQLKPKNSQAKVTIIGELNRPPLERNAANQKLFELAKHAGKRLNIEVIESSVGGGSDGNYTSALGIPTIDGLGIPGDGPHARHEHIRFDLFVERCALVAEMCMIYGEQINYQNK
ncbi:M20 family metallopeptidase [Paenisporosarcina quisquiliarum]|uniref:M20 family metallopeptidase n=1 Tax=Paenisporosarcina quisquiliarum TaxID=365346 RepID=A0A9X3RCE4_9BACL|nr:M20 family metallopeptidase [Paenisporosarcina quisquiliarum]MCZ8536685.1 M20 family metallopeptidase [Paenisporosarcina quisquiliarum]